MGTAYLQRPTIGFLSTWSVYEGTAMDDYTPTLLEGIQAAARQRDCHLLLGCGIGLLCPHHTLTITACLRMGSWTLQTEQPLPQALQVSLGCEKARRHP